MSYWYCNDCKRELCPENVTFEEKCDTCGHNAIWIETEDDESVEQMLQELKECRESSLRPATKFVNENSMFTQMNQISQEFREVAKEVEKIFDGEGNNDDLIMELIDLQTACETELAILGLDESQRMQARRKVIAKNQARGYYCE